jgi:hypothetical protein
MKFKVLVLLTIIFLITTKKFKNSQQPIYNTKLSENTKTQNDNISAIFCSYDNPKASNAEINFFDNNDDFGSFHKGEWLITNLSDMHETSINIESCSLLINEKIENYMNENYFNKSVRKENNDKINDADILKIIAFEVVWLKYQILWKLNHQEEKTDSFKLKLENIIKTYDIFLDKLLILEESWFGNILKHYNPDSMKYLLSSGKLLKELGLGFQEKENNIDIRIVLNILNNITKEYLEVIKLVLDHNDEEVFLTMLRNKGLVMNIFNKLNFTLLKLLGDVAKQNQLDCLRNLMTKCSFSQFQSLLHIFKFIYPKRVAMLTNYLKYEINDLKLLQKYTKLKDYKDMCKVIGNQHPQKLTVFLKEIDIDYLGKFLTSNIKLPTSHFEVHLLAEILYDNNENHLTNLKTISEAELLNHIQHYKPTRPALHGLSIDVLKKFKNKYINGYSHNDLKLLQKSLDFDCYDLLIRIRRRKLVNKTGLIDFLKTLINEVPEKLLEILLNCKDSNELNLLLGGNHKLLETLKLELSSPVGNWLNIVINNINKNGNDVEAILLPSRPNNYRLDFNKFMKNFGLSKLTEQEFKTLKVLFSNGGGVAALQGIFLKNLNENLQIKKRIKLLNIYSKYISGLNNQELLKIETLFITFQTSKAKSNIFKETLNKLITSQNYDLLNNLIIKNSDHYIKTAITVDEIFRLLELTSLIDMNDEKEWFVLQSIYKYKLITKLQQLKANILNFTDSLNSTQIKESFNLFQDMFLEIVTPTKYQNK